MPITQVGSASEDQTVTGGPFILPHTVGAGNDLCLIVTPQTPGGDPVASITYNGIALTKAISTIDVNPTASRNSEIWYLVDPPVGTFDVSVTYVNGFANVKGVSAITLAGVVQSNPIGATNWSEFNAVTVGQVSVTTTADDSWVIDSIRIDGTIDQMTVTGANQVEYQENTNNSGASYEPAGAAPDNVTMSWSWPASRDGDQVAAEVLAVQAGMITKDTVVPFEALRTVRKGEPVQKLDHFVAEFAWPLQADDEGMTLRQLANMTSSYGYGSESPGESFAYGNSGSGLLSETLTNAVGGDLDNLAVPLFAPLQAEDTPMGWFSRHAQGRIQLITTPRDFARIGWLLANRGRWDGEQVLPDIFFAPLTEFGTFGDRFGHVQVPVTTPRSVAAFTPGDYLGVSGFTTPPENETAFGPGTFGLTWYFNGLNPGAVAQWPDLPADTMVTTGNFGAQVIILIPSLGLVITVADTTTTNATDVLGQVDTPSATDPQFNNTVALITDGITGPGLVPTFPGTTWTDITDAQADIDTTALDNFITAVTFSAETRGVITRNGYMVRTFGDQTTPVNWASSRKAIFAVLAGVLTTAITNQTVKGSNTAGDDVDHDHPTGDLLLGAPSWFDSTGIVDIASLTFDGILLSELETVLGTAGASVALYQLSNPPIGSRNVAATFTGVVGQTGIFAASIADGRARAVNGNQAEFEDIATTATVTVPSRLGDLVLGFLRWKNSASDVTGTGGASTVLTDDLPTRQLVVASPGNLNSTTFNIDLSAGGTNNQYAFIAVSIAPTSPLISLTPFESLAGVRRDRAIPLEAEGAAVVSSDRVTPLEALSFLQRADAVALESLTTIARIRTNPLETLAGVTRDRAAVLEAPMALARDRLVPLESEGAAVVSRDLVVTLEALGAVERLRAVPAETLAAIQRERLVPLEALPSLSREHVAPLEALAGVAQVRLVPLEAEGSAVISRAVLVPIEALAGVQHTLAVPTESVAPVIREHAVLIESAGIIIARTIVVPIEAEGQALLPPLTIDLIQTAQPLTIAATLTPAALAIALVSTPAPLLIQMED